MEILVNASAPDRATALATMAALGIADVSSGEPVPLVDVTIRPVPAKPGQTLTRSLWNFWYHTSSAETLTKPTPEGGWPPEADLFERTYLLEMIDQSTGIAMEWAAFVGTDGEPPGYETPTGVRLYDPSLIASPNLVKQ